MRRPPRLRDDRPLLTARPPLPACGPGRHASRSSLVLCGADTPVESGRRSRRSARTLSNPTSLRYRASPVPSGRAVPARRAVGVSALRAGVPWWVAAQTSSFLASSGRASLRSVDSPAGAAGQATPRRGEATPTAHRRIAMHAPTTCSPRSPTHCRRHRSRLEPGGCPGTRLPTPEHPLSIDHRPTAD